MIVYQEFSSLVDDLGFSGKTLYSVSNHMDRHYRTVRIPKRSGGVRTLSVPDDLLCAIQRRIIRMLLPLEEISPYASAYREGGSTRRNAEPHVGKPMILKLDIEGFFDHLLYPQVKEKAFPASRYSEQNRILLSILCTCDGVLPQGAPTSPAISNIILRDFDNTVGAWARKQGISYSRYCDDMTFSGDFSEARVIRFVAAELKKLGLFLNRRKTVAARQGQRQSVTGIVVNEKLSIPAGYKRQLRQEMYYCMRFGVEAHLKASGSSETPEAYRRKLLGRLQYALSVERENPDMQRWCDWLKAQP